MSEHEPFATNLLFIELGKNVIESLIDCELLFNEVESIAEDYPGYLPVFVLGDQSNGTA